MYNLDHLNALKTRLDNEQTRTRNACTLHEMQWRQMVVDGVKREIEQEIQFLKSKGIDPDAMEKSDSELLAEFDALTDDELLNELLEK